MCPNWCDCELWVYGDINKRIRTFPKDNAQIKIKDNSIKIIKELKRFKKFAGNDSEHIDFNKFAPYPEKYKKMDDKAEIYRQKKGKWIKDGFNSGGYEWCWTNWGTKWNVHDVECRDKNLKNGQLKYYFGTAWSPPVPVIIKMSELFPLLTFKLRYYEGGTCFKGLLIFKNKKVLERKESDYRGGRGG